jgi:hypothetical protein
MNALFDCSFSSKNRISLRFVSDIFTTLPTFLPRIVDNPLFHAHAVYCETDYRSAVHSHLFCQLLDDAGMSVSQLEMDVYGVRHRPMIMEHLWELCGCSVGGLGVDSSLLPGSLTGLYYATFVLYSQEITGPTILLSPIEKLLMLLNYWVFAPSENAGYVSLTRLCAKETSHAKYEDRRRAASRSHGNGRDRNSPRQAPGGAHRIHIPHAALSAEGLPNQHPQVAPGSSEFPPIGALCLP